MKVTFELNYSELNDIAYSSLGNMTIEFEDIKWSTKNRLPDQSFMLFISLDFLFDGLVRLETKKTPKFDFNGIDSSLELHFQRRKEELLLFETWNKRFTVPKDEFIAAVWKGYKNLLEELNITLEGHLGSESIDLQETVQVFKSVFKGIVKEN